VTIDVSSFVLGFAVVLAIVAALTIWAKGKSHSTVNIHASLERIRDVGELTVLTAYIKEVVTMKTERDGIFTSAGKIILICGFDIEFRYDLKKIKITQSENGAQVTVLLPPHFLRVIPKETQFYDERKAALLGVVRTDFTVEQRNQLLQGARERAVEQAGILQGELQEKVRASAKATIAALAEAFGAKNVVFAFEDSASVVQQLSDQLTKKAA
jgi:hypothetical protein